MRHDDCAGFAEVLIPADVITVPVCVDEKPHGLISERAHRSEDLLGQRRELIVDHERAVFADG